MAKSRLDKHRRKILADYKEKETAMSVWMTTNFPLALPKIFRTFFEYAMFRATVKPSYNYVMKFLIWLIAITS